MSCPYTEKKTKLQQQIEAAAAPQLLNSNPSKKAGFMFCQIEWHELEGKWKTTSIGWYGGSIEHRLKEELAYFEESWTSWDGECPPDYRIFNEKWGATHLVLDCLSIGYDHECYKDADPEESSWTPTEELGISERTQRASIGWYAYPCNKDEFRELTSELVAGTPPVAETVKWVDGVWKGKLGNRPMLWTGKPNFGMRGKYYLPS